MALRQASLLTSSLRRLRMIARTLSESSSRPTITVEPPEALIDEPVTIKVKGLRQGQRVTLSAIVTNDGKDFLSCAHYTADVKGQVNTCTQPSEGGSFTGLEPMGLFWSMTQSTKQRKGSRLVKKDVTTPYITLLSVLPNHKDRSSIQSASDTSEALASAQIKRWYMGKGVQRIPVREGRIRGALFIPSGDGPFPAVLDMFGASGGLFDFRGALLASRGYLTLSLAYLYYEDLPPYEELEFSYFTEAADWLSRHSKATPGGIGVMGVSLGAALTYQLGAYCPQVKAVVGINGFLIFPLPDQMIEGKLIKGHMLGFTRSDDGYGKAHYGNVDVNTDITPIWRQKVKTLCLFSEDDKCNNKDLYRYQVDKIPIDERDSIEIVFYPRAGHLLEPPYAPLCYESFVFGQISEGTPTGFMLIWGGETKSHAEAQEDTWRRTLEHFNKYLSGNNS